MQKATCHMYSIPVLAALFLMLLGLAWHGMSVSSLVWGVLALAVMLLPLHAQAHAAVGRFLRGRLASPCSNSQFELKEERAQAVAPLSGPRS